MINLRVIANAAIQSINPNLAITIGVPGGFTIDPDTLLQVPSYTEHQAFGNVQALSSDDLNQIAGLNQEGTLRAVYLYGNWSGVLRPEQQPNTVLKFTTNQSGIVAEREWNVFKMLEEWKDWCKVAVVLQTPESEQ